MPNSATPVTYLKLVGAMFMWGGTWIAGRVIAQELPAPMAAASIRFFMAAASLGAFALATEGEIPRLAGSRDWGVVTGLALTGIFFYNLCFFYGLKQIPAGRGALVVALSPVIVALLAWFLGSERMNLPKAAGISLAMAGCLTVIGNGDPLALLQGAVGVGEWLILGCAVFWSTYTFIGRHATKTLSPLASTLYACVIGAVLLGVVSLAQGDVDPGAWSWRVWTSVVFLAIGGTALGFTWYADGVKRLGAARAAVFINLVPVFAVLQAAWLLNERLGLAVLAGGALVIAGVWLTNRKREKTA